MACEPDQLLLRRYADAHDRGERELASELWERLAVNNFDRVQQTVKAFRFSPGGPALPEHEWGSAASEAYLRVIAMGAGFRNREIGRYRAALVTCVQNTCRDYGRKELRHAKRAGGSIDMRFEPGGDAGPYDAALAAYDAELRERAHDAVQAEHSRIEAEDLVAWAIAQVENAKYREVLELTLVAKLSSKQVAERLGIRPDNVDARRSRGGKELERILRGVRA
jgi:RNA polymerase sigma factor (sigma-70 family)